MNDSSRNRILVGDVRQQLLTLPDGSIDCVITSPPYFGLRDYGTKGQLGAEPHVDEWVRQLLEVCRQVNRALKPTGSLWLNLGDGYSRHSREGATKKSLLMGPQRLALALCADGWILRNQIIWAKRNPMPSSVSDRLSPSHEVIYFFTRRQQYYFDLNAIREEPRSGYTARRQQTATIYPPRASAPLTGNQPRIDLNHGIASLKAAGQNSHPLGKNPGDVWQVATASYHGAHFATFPAELVRRPLLATCPEKVCSTCGIPWERAPELRHGRRLATGPLEAACKCAASAMPGLVLDPFMGSGTVAVAAEQYHRDWLGMELNPAYADLAMPRIRRTRQTTSPR